MDKLASFPKLRLVYSPNLEEFILVSLPLKELICWDFTSDYLRIYSSSASV